MKVANMLQEAGAVVRVGIPNLKVHCKVILVTRRKAGRLQRFAHIGTGNFHERNASVYEDLMLLTANPKVTGELAKLFDFFENSFERKVYRHLFVSPFSTRRRFVKLIDDEIHRAERGEAAWMDIKVNNLVDAGMIDKLYQASQAGVKVRMVVRGICALRAGVPGWSDNIEVRSVVGRYLEHSRLFVFGNGGKPLTYISSADWMTRNLDRRVEVTVPIFDAQIATELRAFFDTLWADNTRARLLTPDRTNPWISSSNGPLVDTHRDVYLVLREQTG